MEMRSEKNNCNLVRKTRNFYSVTPKLKLSDLDYLLKLKWGWGWGGILQTEKTQSGKICLNFHFLVVVFWGGGRVFWNLEVKVPRFLTMLDFGGGIL